MKEERSFKTVVASTQISRRDFLKLLEANAIALAVPPIWRNTLQPTQKWPSYQFSALPYRVRAILERVPAARIDEKGYLAFFDPATGKLISSAPLAPTLWNQEKNQPYDRLDPRFSWGIVLHWYGDKENFDNTLEGYLRGFDDLRDVEGYITRTSAHFLVGDTDPYSGEAAGGKSIAVVQTQAPDTDGTPFVASHLRPLNYQSHKDKEQYFVRALYQLGYSNPCVHSLLQDLFDGPRLDPNMRTVAIEITGYDFENLDHAPSLQKIANVVAVTWAVMQRYHIPASHLLGHHEITLGKADPGKKFMALIRFLIGVKALLENDPVMKSLVFGQFLGEIKDPGAAEKDYFDFVRGFLVLTSHPCQVYDWERSCNYWLFNELLAGEAWNAGFTDGLIFPIQGSTTNNGCLFLKPENHEGVDVYAAATRQSAQASVHLVAGGECIYYGVDECDHVGKAAIFRHRQPDGAQVLTHYGNLEDFNQLLIGKRYPQGYPLGVVTTSGRDPYLHFAIAYGATWETDLRTLPHVPTNAGTTWIQRRYLHPGEYLVRNSGPIQAGGLPELYR